MMHRLLLTLLIGFAPLVEAGTEYYETVDPITDEITRKIRISNPSTVPDVEGPAWAKELFREKGEVLEVSCRQAKGSLDITVFNWFESSFISRNEKRFDLNLIERAGKDAASEGGWQFYGNTGRLQRRAPITLLNKLLGNDRLALRYQSRKSNKTVVFDISELGMHISKLLLLCRKRD